MQNQVDEKHFDLRSEIEARLQEINSKIDSWMGQPDSNESRDKQRAILLLDEARDAMDAALIQLTTLTDNRDAWALLAEQARRRINELQTQLTASVEEITRLTSDRDAKSKRMWELGHELDASAAQEARLRAALKDLRINANRLCDRNHGGTYEEDCRRSITQADAVLQKASR